MLYFLKFVCMMNCLPFQMQNLFLIILYSIASVVVIVFIYRNMHTMQSGVSCFLRYTTCDSQKIIVHILLLVVSKLNVLSLVHIPHTSIVRTASDRVLTMSGLPQIPMYPKPVLDQQGKKCKKNQNYSTLLLNKYGMKQKGD